MTIRQPLLSLGAVALLLTLLTVHGVQRQFLNADHIMYSIMSLDEVTLFYWRQNRFLSAIPFLASPISDPYLNLFAVTALSALSHLLCLALLYVTARSLIEERVATLRELLPGILLIWGLVFALFRPEALYVLLQHHEYSLAISLLLAAWLLLPRVFRASSLIGRVGTGLLVASLLGIALGVNPSVIVIGFALLVLQVVLRTEWRPLARLHAIWIIALLVCFIIWSVIMTRQGDEGRYFSIRWNEVLLGFQLGIASFVSQFELFAAIPVLVLVLVFAGFILRGKKRGESSWPRTLAAAVLAMLFALFWILGFSTVEWVFENDHSARYFVPASYILVLLLTLMLAGLLKRTLKSSQGLAIGLGLLLSASLVFKAPIAPNLLTAPAFQSLPTETSRSLVLAGDYWKVWPQYFLLKVEGETPVSLANRSKARADYFRGELATLLEQQQPVTAWCMNADPARCERQVTLYLRGSQISDFKQISAQLQEFFIRWDAEE